MAMVIGTNLASITTQRHLSNSRADMETAMERLSSGNRINSAMDDAAGLTIAHSMESKISGLNQGVKNANDAISAIGVAEGALEEISNMLNRMKEISTQAASDTYIAADRTAMNAEFTALRDEIESGSGISVGTSVEHKPFLVVDLDETLLHSDMLYESLASVLSTTPFSLFKLPVWLLAGKARVKQELALRAQLDITTLPYNSDVLLFIKQERARGRKIILCTASDKLLAASVATHLELFDDVIASDGLENIGGVIKAQILKQRYGQGSFDYIGNSKADLPVWQVARSAIVVNSSKKFVASVAKSTTIERVICPGVLTYQDILSAVRAHQWVKNLLLFVPLLATHRLNEPLLWQTAILAFVSFSLCASAVYILNDLIDLDSDRRHKRKMRRVFAAGRVPIVTGFALTIFLGFFSLILALVLGPTFLLVLASYFVSTSLYSFALKKIVLIDCLVLAGLYTMRIIAGSEATVGGVSLWLLGFSFFLFLSLAYVKRYAEIRAQIDTEAVTLPGRGYITTDMPIVALHGVGAGYAAIVVLALYLNSDVVQQLYAAPWLLALIVPILVFWISWMWLRANRGDMHDDPIIFAITDPVSQLAGVAFAIIIICGAMGWPW